MQVGEYYAVLGSNDVIYFFDRKLNMETPVFKNTNQINSKILCSDGFDQFAVAGENGLHLFTLTKKKLTITGSFSKICFSSSSKYLAAIKDGTKLILFCGSEHHEMDSNANYMSFSPGETWLIIGLK